ncbi:MAG: hypothetical protein U0229_12725 [Anaeromyxobacter sp.]
MLRRLAELGGATAGDATEEAAPADAGEPYEDAPPAPPPAARRTPTPPVGTPRPSPVNVEASSGDESFDIARELAEELGGEAEPAAAADDFQYSVEDVFNQFKKGVAETVRPEDSATHYDLGIAYKEMGLVDDAVKEFETAMRDRKREVDCLSMIALCRMQQGQHREAILVLRRALGSDWLSRDAAKAIHYDLAGAYEAAGDPEVALYVLQKIVKADPAYRDVKGRVAALGGGPGHPPRDERGARPPGARTTVKAPAPEPAPAPAPGKKNIGYL